MRFLEMFSRPESPKMPLCRLPEMTLSLMMAAPSTLLMLVPFANDVPMPRAFGRATDPVGSVPTKR